MEDPDRGTTVSVNDGFGEPISSTDALGRKVTLVYDNGEGLEFRRTIAVDDKFLFTIKDEVTNKGASPVSLYPYALISRHGTPQTLGYYILHEGLIGVLGDSGLQEFTYKTIEDKKLVNFDVTNGWLGITDKYWAATLLPDPSARLKARFSTGMLGNNVNIGAGQVTVDLTGERGKDLQAELHGGVGEATIRLPKNVGVVATVHGSMGSIDVHGLKEEDGQYVNAAYGKAPTTLHLNVEGGIGHIKLEQE